MQHPVASVVIFRRSRHRSFIQAFIEKVSRRSNFEFGRALALLKREGRCPSDVEHRQIKYRNNVIECDHGKLKRIIGATLGFKSMKTAYATIKGIEVMRALRKGQASAFYYGDPLGEMRLVSRVFEM